MLKVYFTNGSVVTYNAATTVNYHGDWLTLLKDDGRYLVAIVQARCVVRVDGDRPCNVERYRTNWKRK